MANQQSITKSFYHMFENLFNELWLVPLLYGYYKPTIIVSGCDYKMIKIWDLHTCQLINTFALSGGHTGQILSIAVHNNQIASGSSDKTIRVWNLETGCIIHILTGHTDAVQSVCFDNTHNRIISGSVDQTIRVWDSVTGLMLRILTGHTGSVQSVCFSKVHNNRIVSGSCDGTIKIWDHETGDIIHTLAPIASAGGHINAVQSICFNKKHNQIISGWDDRTIRTWDFNTGQMISVFNLICFGGISSVYFDERYCNLIVSCVWDSTVRILDSYTGVLLRTLTNHTHYITSIAVHDNLIISCDYNRMIRVWDQDTGFILNAFATGHMNGAHIFAIQ